MTVDFLVQAIVVKHSVDKVTGFADWNLVDVLQFAIPRPRTKPVLHALRPCVISRNRCSHVAVKLLNEALHVPTANQNIVLWTSQLLVVFR